MKKLMILLPLFLILISCAPKVVAQTPAEIGVNVPASGKISGEALLDLMEEGKVQVIDVRSPEEYAQGHVEGAVNFPVEEIIKDPAVVTLSKDQPIAVYCRTGVRSGEAFKVLQEFGFTHIFDAPGVAIYDYELVQ